MTLQLLNRIATISRSQFVWTVADLDCRTRRNHELLRQAQVIVLTVRLEFAPLCNTRRLLDSWKQNQIDCDRVFLFAAPAGRAAEVAAADAETLLQQKFIGRLPNDPAAANLSANCGNPIVDESPKSASAKALSDLVAAVCGVETPDCQRQAGPASRSVTNAGLLRRVAGVLF